MLCQAFNIVSPTASDQERSCSNEAGSYTFNGSYGPKRLCDKHAKSYKEFGYILDQVKDDF